MSQTTATPVEAFSLALDPPVPLEEWVRRGNYDCVNPAVTSANFPLTQRGSREVVLFAPRQALSSKEVVRWMQEEGYKPAGIDECLALGAQYPERQRANPLVFLGRPWRNPQGRRRVPVLVDSYGRRKISLHWFDTNWSDVCCFAAVRLEK